MPSVNRNPTARSSSWPGVRIVIETSSSARLPSAPRVAEPNAERLLGSDRDRRRHASGRRSRWRIAARIAAALLRPLVHSLALSAFGIRSSSSGCPRRSARRRPSDQARVDVAQARDTEQRHVARELGLQDLERLGDAGFSARAEPVEMRTAGRARARAERERFRARACRAARRRRGSPRAGRRRRRTISLSTSNGAGEKSSCRPPWFETITAVAPMSAARFASPPVMMPLIANGPPHSLIIHSASFQVTLRSICAFEVLNDAAEVLAAGRRPVRDVRDFDLRRREVLVHPLRLHRDVEQAHEREAAAARSCRSRCRVRDCRKP